LNTLLEGAIASALGRQVFFIHEIKKDPEHFFDIEHVRKYRFSPDKDHYIDWKESKNEEISKYF
jgi:hypothetical protein